MVRNLGMVAFVAVMLMPVTLLGQGKEKTYSGLTSNELNKVLDGLAKKDWEPVEIRGYAKDKESHFDCTFKYKPNGPGWFSEWDMTEAEYAKAKNKHGKTMRVIKESTWEVKNEKRYWAVWQDKK